MPYKSLAQERYFNANRSKIGGAVVDEFNQASKGMKLPKVKTSLPRAYHAADSRRDLMSHHGTTRNFKGY